MDSSVFLLTQSNQNRKGSVCCRIEKMMNQRWWLQSNSWCPNGESAHVVRRVYRLQGWWQCRTMMSLFKVWFLRLQMEKKSKKNASFSGASLQADKNGFIYSPEECVWSWAHFSVEEKKQVLPSWNILVGPGHELQPLPVGHWAWGSEVRSHVCWTAPKGHLVLYVPLDMRARVTQRKLICAQTWATHWPF